MFVIQPLGDNLHRTLGRALKVATESPNESLIFKFNDIRVFLDPNRDLAWHMARYWDNFNESANV